jgi:hypothetical protein
MARIAAPSSVTLILSYLPFMSGCHPGTHPVIRTRDREAGSLDDRVGRLF